MEQNDLKETLEDLMRVIERRENCLPYLQKLEILAKKINLDPRLAHFLERRSYEKALSFLKEQEVARGSCEK